MTYENIIAAIGLLGIGAILNNILSAFLERKKVKNTTQHEFKQTRYKAILLLMYASLDFDKQNTALLQHNRNFQNKDELMEELKTEWTNMVLYADDKVIKALKAFLQTPNNTNYLATTLAMRKDLYGIKSKLQTDDLMLEYEH